MTVRFKLAATIVATGFITLLAVVACVLYAFMRFEHETTFQRANAFLARVTATLKTSGCPRWRNAWGWLLGSTPSERNMKSRSSPWKPYGVATRRSCFSIDSRGSFPVRTSVRCST